MARPDISLVITDLDNTLYDWLAAFVPAFYEMASIAAPLLEVSSEELLGDLQAVHRRHGDSEHPFALLETNAVKNKFGGELPEAAASALDPAFHAFNRARKKNLALYPGVYRTLQEFSNSGVRVVAFTDARVINSLFRLQRLDIKHFISRLYAPAHIDRKFESDGDDFVRILPHQDRKPNPRGLLEICSDYGVDKSNAVYVGDSLVRDIYMAREAGLHSAWAKYGTLYDKSLWQKLVRVTHWTDEDVEREKLLKEEAAGVLPDCVLNEFGDLLRYFNFKGLNDPPLKSSATA